MMTAAGTAAGAVTGCLEAAGELCCRPCSQLHLCLVLSLPADFWKPNCLPVAGGSGDAAMRLLHGTTSCQAYSVSIAAAHAICWLLPCAQEL